MREGAAVGGKKHGRGKEKEEKGWCNTFVGAY